jgi:hypothetical protein
MTHTSIQKRAQYSNNRAASFTRQKRNGKQTARSIAHKIKNPPKGEEATSQIFPGVFANTLNRYAPASGIELQKFSILRRNPIVSTAMRAVRDGVFWVDGQTKPHPKNDYDENPEFEDLDNEIIQFVQVQLDTIGINNTLPPNAQNLPTFKNYLFAALDDGRTYGNTIAELVWNSTQGFHRLEKIKTKPPWNFDYSIDTNDELEAVLFSSKSKSLDPTRFLIGVWPTLKWGNYFGESDLLNIEPDIKALESIEASFNQGLQQNNLKSIVGHLRPSHLKEANDKIKDDIGSLEAGSILIIDKTKDGKGDSHKTIEFEATPDLSSDEAIINTTSQIQELIKRINRALGVPDDLGNVTSGEGSYARAKTQFDMYISTVEMCQNWLKELANKIVSTIIWYNWETLPEDYQRPVWEWDEVEEEYSEKVAKYLEVLIKNGIITSDEARLILKMAPMETDEEQEISMKNDDGVEEDEDIDETDEDMENIDNDSEPKSNNNDNDRVTLKRAIKDTEKLKKALLKKQKKRKSFFRRLFNANN